MAQPFPSGHMRFSASIVPLALSALLGGCPARIDLSAAAPASAAIPQGYTYQEARALADIHPMVEIDLEESQLPHAIPVDTLPFGFIELRVSGPRVVLLHGERRLAPARETQAGDETMQEFFIIREPQQTGASLILEARR